MEKIRCPYLPPFAPIVAGLGGDPGRAGDGGDVPQAPRFGPIQPQPLHCHQLEEGLLAHIQLFLSTVSAEFKGYREMLRRNLNLPDVTIQIQEDFIAGGVPTLDKLDLYIRECDAVIHLVGDGLGSLAKPRSLAYVNEHYPDLASRLPPLGGFLAADGPSLSYTQWEAWLALLHGRKLLICVPTPEAPREEGFTCDPQHQVLQQEHLARLRGFEVYPEVSFRSIDHLTWQIQSSLFLELRTAAGQIRRPTTLPYAPLGDLLKGRDDDLQKLQQLLGPIPENAATPSTAVALIGMGGVGKTRLAIEHAWRNAARHSAVLFAQASTPEALYRTLAALAAVLDLPAKDATEEAVQRQAVIGWLGSHPGWLLILDGIDSKAAAQAVEALLPQISGGQVLFTTRLSKWSAAVQRLPLEVLSIEAAAAFLLERTASGRRDEPDDPVMARVLAQDLDGLALALEQAGAYIDERAITFTRYRKDWQVRRERVLSWFDPQLMQYPQSVATTWLTSFQELSANAQTLLRRLAWLSPDPIPESLLGVDVPPNDGDTAEPIEAMEALVELDRYSLVSRSRQSDSFLLHRLVQEVGRQGQLKDPATSQLEPALRWLDAAFQGDPQDVRSWPMLDPLAAHVHAVAGFADGAGLADHTAQLMSAQGLLLWSKGRYAEAEPLLRRALAIDEAAYGPVHPDVARDLNNLARLLKDMNGTNRLAEAEPLIRRALAIDEAAYGPKHPDVARDLSTLVSLLQNTNRLAEAEPLMRRALAIDEAAYGTEHPKVATALGNLASLLQNMNRLAEAEPLIRRALAIDEAAYGPDHPSVAYPLNNLSTLMYSTNRLAEAEPLLRRALAINEGDYGPDHPIVAYPLNNLAILLQATNRLTEAEPLMRRTLAIDEAAYGTEHPKVATALGNLASLLQNMNRLAEAEPLLSRALAIDEAAYGTEHPKVATALGNLASLLLNMNRLAEAEPLLSRALAIDEAAYGTEHPEVATALGNLASLLLNMNRLAEAEPLLRRTLAIAEAAYGPEHPDAATALNNLATLLKDTNRLEEAEPLLRRTLAIAEAAYGPEHPDAATALNNLATLLKDTNRLEEAEPLLRRTLAIAEAAYGPEHPAVATALQNLAMLLKDTNRSAEAEPLMRRALAIDESAFDPDHPDGASAVSNLMALLVTNRLAEAEPLLPHVVEFFEVAYGPDNPTVATALNNLAQLLQAMICLAEAETLLTRALAIDETAYGHDHPDVAIALNNLAEGASLVLRALENAEAPYGPNRPDVVTALNELAALQAKNRLAEAEHLVRSVVEIFEAVFGPYSDMATALNNQAQLPKATIRPWWKWRPWRKRSP
jgi:tetratricopeptide (TPR) repeat protein